MPGKCHWKSWRWLGNSGQITIPKGDFIQDIWSGIPLLFDSLLFGVTFPWVVFFSRWTLCHMIWLGAVNLLSYHFFHPISHDWFTVVHDGLQNCCGQKMPVCNSCPEVATYSFKVSIQNYSNNTACEMSGSLNRLDTTLKESPTFPSAGILTTRQKIME